MGLNGGPGKWFGRPPSKLTEATMPLKQQEIIMSRSTIFFAAAAALAATAATVSFPAFAGTPSVRVAYSDLNLASASGATELKARVNRAAKAVCANEGDKSLDARSISKQCARISAARAMPQVEFALANAGTQVAENTRVSVAAH